MNKPMLKGRACRALVTRFCLCGFIVLCAFSNVRAEQVEVTSVSGTVEVLLEGADDYTAAEEGMTLEAGDTIKTSAGASAEISFNEANTNVVRLNENTDSKITLSDDEKMDVSSGEVFASVSDLPSGSAFEIRTPTAVSGARGTDWVTKVSDEGTDVEAVDSVPYVRHFETSGMKSGQMTMIQPGQMTTVKRFQPPTQPRPMNVARQQQWQSMKQQVRQRAGEAVIKRQQRPQFDRKDFIQQMKGKKEYEGEFKPLRSGDKPNKPLGQQNKTQEPGFSGNNRSPVNPQQQQNQQSGKFQGPEGNQRGLQEGALGQSQRPGPDSQNKKPMPKNPAGPTPPGGKGPRR